jgi:hypothetical protein
MTITPAPPRPSTTRCPVPSPSWRPDRQNAPHLSLRRLGLGVRLVQDQGDEGDAAHDRGERDRHREITGRPEQSEQYAGQQERPDVMTPGLVRVGPAREEQACDKRPGPQAASSSPYPVAPPRAGTVGRRAPAPR